MKGLVQRFHNYAEWLTVCGRWYFAIKINTQERSMNSMIRKLRKYA